MLQLPGSVYAAYYSIRNLTQTYKHSIFKKNVCTTNAYENLINSITFCLCSYQCVTGFCEFLKKTVCLVCNPTITAIGKYDTCRNYLYRVLCARGREVSRAYGNVYLCFSNRITVLTSQLHHLRDVNKKSYRIMYGSERRQDWRSTTHYIIVRKTQTHPHYYIRLV